MSQGTDRFVWANHKLIRLPSSLKEVLTNPLTRRLPPRVALEALFPPGLSALDRDVTIGEFISKKFGRDAKLLVSAMVAGIFAGDVDSLSIKSCFPDMVRLNQAGNGSLVRGLVLPAKSGTPPDASPEEVSPLVKASGITFKDGMGRIAQRLEEECRKSNVTMMSSSAVQKLQRDGSRWSTQVQSGESINADIVVSTLSPRGLADILSPQSIPELEYLKTRIGKVDVAVVNLAYDSHDVSLPPKGFGHLVADRAVQAETGCLGVIYDSNAFPQQQPDHVAVVSVMMGGAHAPWVSTKSQSELVEMAKRAMLDHLNVGVKPLETSAVLHRNCIPQYKVGHFDAAQATRKRLADENLIMYGTGVLGAGIADAVGGALIDIETKSWAA